MSGLERGEGEADSLICWYVRLVIDQALAALPEADVQKWHWKDIDNVICHPEMHS